MAAALPITRPTLAPSVLSDARPILDELMRLLATLRPGDDVATMKRAMSVAGLAFASDSLEGGKP